MTDGATKALQAAAEGRSASSRPKLGLALGGGAARGLAHIGVLSVLEREGIGPDCIAASSMGGLIGALSAAGMRAWQITELARRFRFPSFFVFGRVVHWDHVFPTAAESLRGLAFEQLRTPLLLTAVDLQAGSQVILERGPLLPAVRATCAVPGVLPPVKLSGRWLVDGSLLNVLPVDVAWTAAPEVVVAVNVGGLKARRMPQLEWMAAPVLSWLSTLLPNPASARLSFDILTRASEITLTQQTTLATAMTGPEVVVEPSLDDFDFVDFDRLDEAVQAGARAMELALPELERALHAPRERDGHARIVHFDPVCAMALNPSRARAQVTHRGEVYYFCSENCRDVFVRGPERHVGVSLGRSHDT